MVEVGAQPVGVGHLVARAGGDQQLVGAVGTRSERLAGRVEVEAKPALQAAADLRVGALPRAVLRQRHQPRQVVATGELLQQQVG